MVQVASKPRPLLAHASLLLNVVQVCDPALRVLKLCIVCCAGCGCCSNEYRLTFDKLFYFTVNPASFGLAGRTENELCGTDYGAELDS